MAAAQTISTTTELPASPIKPRPQTSRVLSGSPRTPLLGRSISGAFGSPGAYGREPEEVVVYELTPRLFSAGFSGESKPRCISRFGYSVQDGRRTGDYHNIAAPISLPVRPEDPKRYDRFELYRSELRDVDLRLVRARLERTVRSVHIDYLQLDSKPRRAILVVSTLTPTKILDLALSVLFDHYAQPPSITLMSRPVMACVSAGLRNALVLDIGWEETTASVVGEYRVIAERRSVRGGRMLTDNLVNMLKCAAPEGGSDVSPEFTMVENIRERVAWCSNTTTAKTTSRIQLPFADHHLADVAFDDLSAAVESALLDTKNAHSRQDYDDQEHPLPDLAIQTLSAVSPDLRASCATRIVVTGPHAKIPGLKARLLQEIQLGLDKHGWLHKEAPATRPARLNDHKQANGSETLPSSADKALAETHTTKTLTLRPFGLNVDKVYPSLRAADGHVVLLKDVVDGKAALRPDWRPLDATDFRLDLIKWLKEKQVYREPSSEPVKEANASSTKDPATQKLDRDLQKKETTPFDGKVRGVHSLGAWTGASMVANLHVKGVLEIEREEFLKHGYRETIANII